MAKYCFRFGTGQNQEEIGRSGIDPHNGARYMGKLTTHVLDTATGRPADRVKIELYRLENQVRQKLLDATTNVDGRCDAPLLEGDAFRVGEYELIFHVGAYFGTSGKALPTPRFLDLVPVRFGVSDADGPYHVPLLISPFGYSTYRGS